MCGIAGFYNINPCSDGVFTSMRHRGSDGEGYTKTVLCPCITLGLRFRMW